MFKVIFYTFAAIMIYRFVFRFMLPLLQVTKNASIKMRQMQQQMNDMQQKQAQTQQKPPTVKDGDYIEYEEVK